ncbi:hypothetical protein [Armatimonas sp.]|uniref:hypothetical protein n=1 Tax=Armatimonas sp. TaxID=1872638 RepID=UPI00286AADD5|nr:hypothetical protein [Armatimonas sp.]
MTQATALNNHGQVVGNSDKYIFGIAHGQELGNAFIWDDGFTDPLRGYGLMSRAFDINDNGDVVGTAFEDLRTGLAEHDEESHWWPALWVGDPKDHRPDDRPLRLPDNSEGAAYRINNRRVIVGSPESLWRPESAHRMKHTRLTIPEKVPTFRITGINDFGGMIGVSYFHSREPLIGDSAWEAWLWRKGKWVRLSPELKESAPQDLNDEEFVVGWGRAAGAKKLPMLWKDGKGTPLSEQEGDAQAINNKGRIVGSFWSGNRSYACLWEGGKALNLNERIPINSGWTLYDATNINDKGQIVGTGKFGKERLSAFLLTPQK